jgi:hypothetical protein
MSKVAALNLALERAAQIMAGAVTYRGHEKQLARALLECWQCSGMVDAWVGSARDKARELGLPDDESKGSTQDWRFICEWIEKRKNARATWDRMEDIADKSQERAIDAIQQNVELEASADRMEDALQRIVQWADAYPLDVFPEPNWIMVKVLLKDSGESLDAVSASNMRHVIEGVGRIAKEALGEGKP